MPFIVREDGEHFVVPSYRDILSAKKKNLLKREILLLSSSYGEYVVIQRKNPSQYEVAFSPDTGYLLGETVWHYFKRPVDLIYCEAIPDTNEAILVIVKGGSVYLDGRFPVDSIPEELVIFKTQKNNFAIYVYGNVPISATTEVGKFTLESSSIQSFTVLEESAFAKLPRLKIFQLQLVETALRAEGIGVFPVKELLGVLVFLGLIWMGWTYFTSHRAQVPVVTAGVVNPYQPFINTLTSPDPYQEIKGVLGQIQSLYTMPGWFPESLEYSAGVTRALVKSRGARTNVLFAWATVHNGKIDIATDGFYLVLIQKMQNRLSPTTINKLQEVVASLIDRLSYVYPGNNLQIGEFLDRKIFIETNLTVNFNNVTPAIVDLMGQQFQGLPLVLTKMSIKVTNGILSGSMVLQALGN